MLPHKQPACHVADPARQPWRALNPIVVRAAIRPHQLTAIRERTNTHRSKHRRVREHARVVPVDRELGARFDLHALTVATFSRNVHNGLASLVKRSHLLIVKLEWRVIVQVRLSHSPHFDRV